MNLLKLAKKLTRDNTIIKKTINTSDISSEVNGCWEEFKEILRQNYIVSEVTVEKEVSSYSAGVGIKTQHEIWTSIGYKIQLIPTKFKTPFTRLRLESELDDKEFTLKMASGEWNYMHVDTWGKEESDRRLAQLKSEVQVLRNMLENWTPIVVFSECNVTNSRELCRVEKLNNSFKLKFIGREYEDRTDLYTNGQYIILDDIKKYKRIN